MDDDRPLCAECDTPFVPYFGQGPNGEAARFCGPCAYQRGRDLLTFSEMVEPMRSSPAESVVSRETESFMRANCAHPGGHEGAQDDEECRVWSALDDAFRDSREVLDALRRAQRPNPDLCHMIFGG